MEYSIAYAATKELSVGLNYSVAERNTTATPQDEKVKSIAVGYNMGPVVLVAQYGQVENQGGLAATTADGDVVYLQLSTKF
jgi:predicted porin